MDNHKDIRWRQRFQNFEKAFLQFQIAVNNYERLDDLAKEGLIQRFEYTFELAWKVLKNYLEAEGFMVKSPRETIKQAFQTNLINNGELWINMLEDINLMAHTYDKKNFEQALLSIKDNYYFEIKSLYDLLKNEQ